VVDVVEALMVRVVEATAFDSGVTGPPRLTETPFGATLSQDADSETVELNAFCE
jgi:hypothetical protein